MSLLCVFRGNNIAGRPPPCLSRASEPSSLTFADLSFGLTGLSSLDLGKGEVACLRPYSEAGKPAGLRPSFLLS